MIGTMKSSAYSGGIDAPTNAPTTVEASHTGTIGVATPKKYATFAFVSQCGVSSYCAVEIM